MNNKKIYLLALVVVLGGAFVLGFSNQDFSNGLAQATKSYSTNPPTNLMAYILSSSTVHLYWADNSNNETLFTIERSSSTATSSFIYVGQVSANTTNTIASISNVGPGVTLYYRVKSIPNSTADGYSNIAQITTPGSPTTSSGPTNLTASSTSGGVYLSWMDNSSNETAFHVERSGPSSSSSFAVVRLVGPNTTFTYDTSTLSTGTYFYRVTAVIGQVTSSYSNTASILR